MLEAPSLLEQYGLAASDIEDRSLIVRQMYLIAIHVPIYVRGNTHLLATDWKRSLELLRDSLGDRFGDIYVAAPSLRATAQTDQALEIINPREGIITIASFPFDTRARHYWLRHRNQWEHDLRRLVRDASVVHAGFDDCYRPISWLGFQLGVEYDKPTVFVQDVDHVSKIEASMAATTLARRPERYLYKTLFEHHCRQGVRQASLSLLKGGDLMKRYGPYAKNPQNFHDTSYLTHEIVAAEYVAARVQSCAQGRPLRLIYCGRLAPRKGVDHSIRAISRTRYLGAKVSLDIIGEGPERAKLEALVEALGLRQSVRFHGQRQYGATMLKELAQYDALLFTPECEDTARMIFDGYAAGLPLIGYATPYIQERAQEDGTAIVSPANNVNELARTLFRIDRHRDQLCNLMSNVLEAAHYHSADAWYQRRAEMTFEAVARHRCK